MAYVDCHSAAWPFGREVKDDVAIAVWPRDKMKTAVELM